MRLKLFLLMLLASTLAMTAQTSALTGVVVNGTSGAPVGGATVELKGSKTAVSGFNGDFSLEGLKDGPAYLLITCDGFQPVGLDVVVREAKMRAFGCLFAGAGDSRYRIDDHKAAGRTPAAP